MVSNNSSSRIEKLYYYHALYLVQTSPEYYITQTVIISNVLTIKYMIKSCSFQTLQLMSYFSLYRNITKQAR